MQQLYSHLVVLPAGDNIALRFVCDEEFLVVGFDAFFRASFAGGSVGNGNFVGGPIVSQPRAWRPAYLLDASGLADGSLSTSRVVSGRGVSIGGFDGVCYAQFARAGETLVLYAADGVNLPAQFIFVLTYSAVAPVCRVEDVSNLL